MHVAHLLIDHIHYRQLYCMAGGPDSSSKDMLHKPQDNVR